MNGVASARMRAAGAPYKLIFGVELPRLQNIAREFTPNHQLAQALWNENIRESKILATLLMPLDHFFPEVADIWVDEVPSTEIAQLASMNLFSRLPYASSLAFEWMASEKEIRQLCGFLIVAHLLQQGAKFNELSLNELRDQMESVPTDAPLALRKAVMSIVNLLSEGGNS